MCTFPSCFLSAGFSCGASRSVLLLPSCPCSVAGRGPRWTQGSCTRALCIGTGWGWRLCGSSFSWSHEPSLGWLFLPVHAFEEDDGLAFLHQPFNQAQGWRFPCRASLWAGFPSSFLRKESCVLAPGLSCAMASPQPVGRPASGVSELGQTPTHACHGAWEPSGCPELMSLQWAMSKPRAARAPLRTQRLLPPWSPQRSSLSSCSAHASF